MTNTKKWKRTVVHTEDFNEACITVSHYTDGTVKGSYAYDVHSPFFPHSDPIASARGHSIEECITHAKKAYRMFWGPLGARRL